MVKAVKVAVARTQILDEGVSHQLVVTARRVSRLFWARYASTCQLAPGEWLVLAALAEIGDVTPSAVSAFTAMDKVKVSRAVSGLTIRGLIKQMTPSRDRRTRVLSLTRKGVAAHSAAARLTCDVEAMLAAGISKVDFAHLQKGLERLNQRVEELSSPGEMDAL